MLYVIETDAPCRCGDQHGYVTQMCNLCVWVDYGSARWVAKHIEGSKVREINEVPPGISYTVFTHVGGKPDRRLPKDARTLSSR